MLNRDHRVADVPWQVPAAWSVEGNRDGRAGCQQRLHLLEDRRADVDRLERASRPLLVLISVTRA
eukprot:753886-Hanusia_phi.AAC.6